MCGIAGVVPAQTALPATIDELSRMAAVLAHRGPDGYGLYRDDHAGLASTRLSIVDLEGGFQPIHNETRSIWLVFNGEIFNHVELRRELIADGHRFYTESDSEVIVHAYERYGGDAWARLNGQFAIALWDRAERRLWLVRDPFGIHPLHYARIDGSIVFASEAKAIFAGGRLAPRLDPRGVTEAFVRWAPSAPTTAFESVRQVMPGSALCFDESRPPAEHRYWVPSLRAEPSAANLFVAEAADILLERMRESLRVRLRADVPVGAYLSGGLDSSLIAALARETSVSLHTFAVRFDDQAFDETAHQRQVAAILGTEHHEIMCRSSDIREALPDVVWHCETPLLRTAPIPLYILSGLVRSLGMKVALTGEGADELFAGYSIFKEDRVRRFWARSAGSTMRPRLLARLHPEIGRSDARSTQLWQQFFARGLTDTEDPLYSHRPRWGNGAWAARALSADLLRVAHIGRLDEDVVAQMPTTWRSWSSLARAQWLEIATFMSPYLLASQGDRVALAHGVEVRYPFLDTGVAEYAFGLPDRFKLAGLRDKVVLRHLAARFLPAEIAERPKVPFRAPTASALFDGPRLPDYAEELLSPSAIVRLGLVNSDVATLLMARMRRLKGRATGEREEMAFIGILTLQLLGHLYRETFDERVNESVRRLATRPPHVLEDVGSGAIPSGAVA